MKQIIYLFVLIVHVIRQSNARPESRQPEQVHLSYGNGPTEMWVTWFTQDDVNATVLAEYVTQPGQNMMTAFGQTTVFVDGGEAHLIPYIHRAKIQVTPGQKYWDFAYDMPNENGAWGDQFFRQIEPIAAYVPYMTVAGNHEEEVNLPHAAW